jgi:excisionase family DNA binding protein
MENNNLADDLLDGVPAIAAFTGWSQRQIYHLAEKGKLPLFKVGERKWCARKSTLKAHIVKLETAE